jgi:hypothetical protein
VDSVVAATAYDDVLGLQVADVAAERTPADQPGRVFARHLAGRRRIGLGRGLRAQRPDHLRDELAADRPARPQHGADRLQHRRTAGPPAASSTSISRNRPAT